MRLALALCVLGLLQGCVAPVVAAGAGAGVIVATKDRRSAGAMVEDDTIESKAQKRIDDKYRGAAKVSVTAYNRFALITGTVASEQSKIDIERIVGSIPNVKGIANELVIGDTTAAGSAGSDARITANVKVRFVKSPAFKADHVKVVTENGAVYLMGLVTHAEADAASEIAATTAGVTRVVRVFEYID